MEQDRNEGLALYLPPDWARDLQRDSGRPYREAAILLATAIRRALDAGTLAFRFRTVALARELGMTRSELSRAAKFLDAWGYARHEITNWVAGPDHEQELTPNWKRLDGTWWNTRVEAER